MASLDQENDDLAAEEHDTEDPKVSLSDPEAILSVPDHDEPSEPPAANVSQPESPNPQPLSSPAAANTPEQPHRMTLEEMKAQDRQQIRTFAIVSAVFLVVIAAAVAGVVVGLGRKNDPSPETPLSMAPTPVPTTPDSHKQCFTSVETLQAAMLAYHLDPENTTLAEQYGQPIGSWCTTPMTSLHGLLTGDGLRLFNADISGWDVSNVVDLSQAFMNAVEFNSPLNIWDTSRVADFSYVFYGCTSYNMPLDQWNTSSGTRFASMFAQTEQFDQDISAWDVSKGQEFNSMFAGSLRFDQDLSSWQMQSATTCNSMFSGAARFQQNLCAWGSVMNETASVSGMFSDTPCTGGADDDFLGTPVLTARPPGPFCAPCF